MSGDRCDCPVCNYGYLSDLPSCPNCAAPNVPSVPPVAPIPTRKSARKAIAAVILAIGIVLATVVILPGLNSFSQFLGSKDVPVGVLQLPTPEPKVIPQGQLVQYALQLINSDRANFSLPAVQLSNNEAAQVHADDVFATKQISHWLTNGEKPYMTYTRYGGTGNVHQNVAIAGFTAEQYQKCNTLLSTCETIDPTGALKELENQMMYNDAYCCENGHRENILDPHHTHVSIGIVYDKYYLAFVENFENDYGLQTSISGGTVHITGNLTSGTLKQIEVHYDPLPTPAIYEQNKQLLSYTAGKILASIGPPLPFGYQYRQPGGYKVVAADDWTVNNNFVNVSFRLAPMLSLQGGIPATQTGVYTVYADVEDAQGRVFEATSYSIFVVVPTTSGA